MAYSVSSPSHSLFVSSCPSPVTGLNVPEEEDRLTCLVGAMEKTRSLFGLPGFPPSEETSKLVLVVLAKAI